MHNHSMLELSAILGHFLWWRPIQRVQSYSLLALVHVILTKLSIPILLLIWFKNIICSVPTDFHYIPWASFVTIFIHDVVLHVKATKNALWTKRGIKCVPFPFYKLNATVILNRVYTSFTCPHHPKGLKNSEKGYNLWKFLAIIPFSRGGTSWCTL